jgi:2-C-methyl-D-erythritol 4-phosphate cytidylyltransferase
MAETTVIAVIVAGGKGTRMGGDRKKQYLELDGVSVLVHTLQAFDRHDQTHAIILVVPESDLGFCNTLVCSRPFDTPVHLVAGGIERQDSVENGLRLAKGLCKTPEQTLVMVHDGVRPFVSHRLMDACLAGAQTTGAVIPAVKIADTIKTVDDQGNIVNTLDRRRLYRAQTPQTFRLDLGLSAFAHAGDTGFRGTDEASILAHSGIPVNVVSGDETNIKLTTPRDLGLAELILSRL